MKSSTDIWFTTFLIEIKGYKLADYDVIGRGRGKFYFDIPDKEWKQEKIDFMKSDLAKAKQGQEKLKDLANHLESLELMTISLLQQSPSI